MASAYPFIDNCRWRDVGSHLEKPSFYARKVMSMWRYRITRLLSRKYPELLIPDALAAERNSKREWNRFLDTHYRRGWNVNVSQVIISHNLKQLRSLFTRKFHPFSSTQVAEEPLFIRR
ncbi:hypothetical protein QT339_30840 (plasmid) [Escherichia coli]|nr:hypothetical protein [Escherichia coli]